MAIFGFFKMAAAAILYCKNKRSDRSKISIRVIVPNFVEIAQIAAEI